MENKVPIYSQVDSIVTTGLSTVEWGKGYLSYITKKYGKWLAAILLVWVVGKAFKLNIKV